MARLQLRRMMAGLAALVLQGLLGLALVFGLAVDVPQRIASAIRLIAIAPDPPVAKPAPVPQARHRLRRAAAAAPPNRRAEATPVVAPPPVVLPDLPPPMVAAPVAGIAAAPSAGAAAQTGPGSGAGGQGEGFGSGQGGDGDGDGTPAQFRRGAIRDSDYPRAAYAAGIGGTVRVRIDIGANGRVAACTVTESSGNADLDTTTCRLIVERFRYRPARDAAGRAVPDVETGKQVWVIGPRRE